MQMAGSRRKLPWKFGIFSIPLLFLAVVAPLYPQGGTSGAISGFVTDPSGSPVAGVNVKVTNVNTGVSYQAGTTTDGYYTVKFLIPGTYRVQVAQPGFKEQVVNGVVVETASNPTVDIKLALGAVSQTVNVTDTTSMIEAQTADSGATVDTERVNDTPTQQRNSFGLAETTVGVIPTSSEKTFTLEDNSKTSAESINGGEDGIAAPTETNDILIDGVEDRMNYLTGGGTSYVGYIPSQDAVGEVKVVTNPYSAEYGHTLGGSELFSTKSGSNQFHGEAFEYNRSFGLSATIFDINRANEGKTPLLYNTPGGQIGGPIKKNKLFFFGSYEYMDEHAPALEFGAVPTAMQRQGDFSQTYYSNNGVATPITLYNPFSCTSSTTVCNSRSVIGSVGDSVIPQSMLDPVAQNMWQYIPLPNAPGNGITGANNYFPAGTGTSLSHTYEIVARGDYNINDKSRITLRAIRENWLSDNLKFYDVANDAAEVAGSFPSGRATNNDLIDYTRTFSPTTVLDVRVGMQRSYWENLNSPIGCQVSPSKLGFNSVFVAQAAPCMPVFGFVGAQGSGSDEGSTTFSGAGMVANNTNPDQINILSGMLLKSMGRHTLKFGGQGIMERGYIFSPGDNAGDFSFSSQYTQQNPSGALTAAQGNPVASFELGVGTAAININSAPARQNLSAAWFVQDDIKVSRKLTINAGLRWDWDGGPTDRFNAITGPFEINATNPLAASVAGASGASNCPACANLVGGLVFPGVNGVSRSPYDSTFKNFGPRLGIAYAFTPNTVVRAGWGLFYQDFIYDPGSAGFSSTTNSVLFSSTYQVLNTIDNPFPTGLIPATGASLGLSTDLGNSVTFVDPHAREPRAQQFNFNVQHQLPQNVLVTVSYNYNGISRLPVNLNINHLSLAQIQQGSAYLTTSVTNPFAGLIPNTSLNKATISQAQLLLPYPEFTTVTEDDMPIGNSSYQGLEIQVTKRWSAGLSTSIAYTNSRHEDRGAYMNPFDTQLMKEVDPYDIPQVLALNGTYELPVGRGKRFASSLPGWANHILGGWQLNWNIRYMTGVPWEFPGAGTTIAGGDIGAGAAPVPGHTPHYSPQTLNQWVNPAAFQNSTNTALCYPAGSSNCIQEWSTVDGHIRMPDIASYDLGVFKSFKITERVKFVFMNNWINATNTPQFFGNPTSSCEAITASCFGKISGYTGQTNQARQIQLGGKIEF
jgi:outer membrane receptor protein involved in Fe transport